MAEGAQESRRQDGKRIVACACGQRYRVPIQAVGTRSCTKCDRPVSLAPTPDGAAEHAGEKLKVFVSYSRKDKDFVLWFSDALQAQDVNVFRDLDDILPTEEWWPRIEKLIAAARVRGVDRQDAAGRRWRGRLLRPQKNKSGGLHVRLYRDGVPKNSNGSFNRG